MRLARFGSEESTSVRRPNNAASHQETDTRRRFLPLFVQRRTRDDAVLSLSSPPDDPLMQGYTLFPAAHNASIHYPRTHTLSLSLSDALGLFAAPTLPVMLVTYIPNPPIIRLMHLTGDVGQERIGPGLLLINDVHAAASSIHFTMIRTKKRERDINITHASKDKCH